MEVGKVSTPGVYDTSQVQGGERSPSWWESFQNQIPEILCNDCGDFSLPPIRHSGAITPMGIDSPFFVPSLALKGFALGATVARGVTTADGFLFRGFTVKAPVNIPVQRFGNMSLGRPDFWGARIGTSQFANRTFGAIKPSWNPLTQYTTGVIPKGTPIKFGIIGPQGWRYPGGSFQFIIPSRSVINQSSKLIR